MSMPQSQPQPQPGPPGEPPDVIVVPDGHGPPGEESGETVEQPAKVMRIGSMIKQLLEEVRQAPLDEASRPRLRELYETPATALADGQSPDRGDKLAKPALP